MRPQRSRGVKMKSLHTRRPGDLRPIPDDERRCRGIAARMMALAASEGLLRASERRAGLCLGGGSCSKPRVHNKRVRLCDGDKTPERQLCPLERSRLKTVFKMLLPGYSLLDPNRSKLCKDAWERHINERIYDTYWLSGLSFIIGRPNYLHLKERC